MKLWKKIPLWFVGFIVILIIIRISLPPLGKWVINHELDKNLGEYTGHVGHFGLALYRGAYRLRDFDLRKKGVDLAPLLQIKEIDISIAWRSLIHKKITTNINIKSPIINLLDSSNKKNQQFGLEESVENWKAVSNIIFPTKIESMKIQDGSVYFTNSDLKKPLPVKFEKVEFQIADLQTRSAKVYSPFQAEGFLQGDGKFSTEGKIDILSKPIKSEVNFKLEHFHVNTINQQLLIYVPIDITYGDLSLYGEAASDGDAIGYLKVFFIDGDIIAPHQKFHSVRHFFTEIVSAMANWILRNNKNKTVAAKIPFHYHNGKLDVNSTKAFWSALKNSGKALPKGIDHSISLQNLEKGKKIASRQTKN